VTVNLSFDLELHPKSKRIAPLLIFSTLLSTLNCN